MYQLKQIQELEQSVLNAFHFNTPANIVRPILNRCDYNWFLSENYLYYVIDNDIIISTEIKFALDDFSEVEMSYEKNNNFDILILSKDKKYVGFNTLVNNGYTEISSSDFEYYFVVLDLEKQLTDYKTVNAFIDKHNSKTSSEEWVDSQYFFADNITHKMLSPNSIQKFDDILAGKAVIFNDEIVPEIRMVKMMEKVVPYTSSQKQTKIDFTDEMQSKFDRFKDDIPF